MNSKKNVEFAGEYIKKIVAVGVMNDKKSVMVNEYWHSFCVHVCKDTIREIVNPRSVCEGSLNSFK